MSTPGFERESFVELVRQALGQLHDRALLQAHPLCAALARAGPPLAAADLQAALLDAIRQVRPDQTGPALGAHWRRYRYLWLRYVEAVPLESIPAALGVTDRQARRDHREALEAVAGVLWTRCRGEPWLPERRDDLAPLADEEGLALEAELARAAGDEPRGPTSLGDVLDGALQTAARLLETRGVRVELAVPADLPPVAVGRALLRQALLSLLAHGATRPLDGRLHLTGAGDARTVTLEMSCTVAGRPAAPPGPTGGEAELPLELARRLIERQGGRLDVAANAAGRERVALRLPAARATSVLLVDDNLDFLRLCQRLLEGSTYRVLAVSLADAALRTAREARPDVVVLDVLMPTQDGWELLAALQRDERTRGIPVVVCSVLKEPTLALGLGAAGFLPKPVTATSLLAALERATARPPAGPASPPGTPSPLRPTAPPAG